MSGGAFWTVAVKRAEAGAPKPDLSSTEAFVRMLRNAKSIGYSQAGSGLMVANIIEGQFRGVNDWPMGSALSTGMMVIMALISLVYIGVTRKAT